MKIVHVELRFPDSTDIETVEDAQEYLEREIPIDFERLVISGIYGVVDVNLSEYDREALV